MPVHRLRDDRLHRGETGEAMGAARTFIDDEIRGGVNTRGTRTIGFLSLKAMVPCLYLE